MGLLGHLKDENSLAQKDVMTCLGNTAQFSTGGKLLTTPHLDTKPEGSGCFSTTPFNRVAFRGSTYSKRTSLHVETHIFIFDLMSKLLILART